MSFHDKKTAFSMEFDEDDESGLGFAKPSKNEQIYGIFNPFDDSDPSPPSPSSIFKPTSFHPAEPDSPKTLPKYFNFKKSDHILYEPSKTIQVKYANKNTIINGPDIDKNTIINDKTPTINNESKALIKSKRIFDFKNKRTSNIDSFDFPKALGQVHKKVKTEIMTPQTTQEAQKLKEQYGKGYLMARNLGFEVGKGLGKEKQGILKPLEAVQKTSYNSNFENRLDQGVPKNRKHDIIDDKPEENEEKGDETEKVVKRWKKNNNRLKRRLPVKELDTEKVFIGEKTMKIIDMRGPETRFLGSMTIPKDINNATTSNKAKNKGLSEFLLVLKSEYEGFKHNLHDFMRKTRFEEDKKITSTYEIGLLENKTKVLTEEKAFLLKALSILKTLEQLDLIEIIKAFDEIIALSSRFTLEFELYLYFLKAFTHKARINPQRISFRPEMKVFLGLFLRIKGNLTVLFPEQRVIDPFDPRKEELMSKRPKKLIEQVFKESIWPGIRGFLTNEFKPIEDSEEIIKFLEDWKGVLPIEVLEEVFESSIRVKLEGEIKEFEPFKARFPLHIWFFQWLPYIKHGCLLLWMKILQQKFIRAFNNWNPNENNQKFLQMVLPWKNIMEKDLFEALIKRAVVPKLMFLIQSLVIKPEKQDIEPIKTFFMWIEVLDNEEIELLLEKPLIEKLERTLDNWIMKPNAKKEEMVVWVNGWKGFLGSVVERIERIGAGFERMKGLVEKKKDI